jgi:hypothetical protein
VKKAKKVAEGAPIVVMPRADRLKKAEPPKQRYMGDIVPPTKSPSTEKRGVKGRPGQRPMPDYSVTEDESGMFSKVMSHETSPEAAKQIQQQGFKKSRTGIFFNVEDQNYSGGGYGGAIVMAKVSGPIDDILNLEDDNDLPDDLDDFADGEEIADYARSEGYWAWTDGVQFAVLDPRHIQVVKQGVTEDIDRAEAQAAYMQGECMILAVAINQYNPQRYPIGYIWEYNMSAGAPDVQLDDDEWEDLSPEEQEEISKDISRHSIVHAYVRDRETNEYIDARGRHRDLPNLWGRMGQTRFEEFPGTARELIDITAHGDWDEVGDQVNFKRGQPAFDSLAGPAGIKRALDYAVKYLGVEGSKNKLRIGNIVRAVVDGKRVQGEVIGISSDYEQVELWLSGVNDFNPITVDVRDIKPVSEQGMSEASLATMRDYYAGDENAKDPTKLSQMRDFFNKHKPEGRVVDKRFNSKSSYEAWLKQQGMKKIGGVKEDTDKFTDYELAVMEGGHSLPEAEKIAGRYDPADFDSMIQRLSKVAKAGPMKTVWDPEKRVYKTVPDTDKQKKIAEAVVKVVEVIKQRKGLWKNK